MSALKNQFVLLIKSSPTSAGAFSGLRFAKAVLNAGHEIKDIFFYGEGTYHIIASHALHPEIKTIAEMWCDFASREQFNLSYCRTAALKREIYHVKGPFKASSIMNFMTQLITTDKFVVF